MIILLGENDDVQIGAASFINFIHFIWLVIAKPFNRRIMNIIEIYVDFIVVIASLSHSLFIILPDESDSIGLYIIIACITAILASATLGFIDSTQKIKDWCKNRKRKTQVAKDDRYTENTITEPEPVSNKVQSIHSKKLETVDVKAKPQTLSISEHPQTFFNLNRRKVMSKTHGSRQRDSSNI